MSDRDDRFPASLQLAGARRGIGMVDAGVLALAATRRALVRRAASAKAGMARSMRDRPREASVRSRAAVLARLLGLPADTADALLDALIADAGRLQGIEPEVGPGNAVAAAATPGHEVRHADLNHEVFMHTPSELPRNRTSAWLRLLPPPRRWAVLLRHMPGRSQEALLEHAMRHALAGLESDGALDLLDDRRIGIDVVDLGLSWVISREAGVLRARTGEGGAEATVRGGVTDLLLLAARLEDADTLFFQRRLVLTGDTELGLTARNLLDRLPWEQLPLALRIVLNRCARLAGAARAAQR